MTAYEANVSVHTSNDSSAQKWAISHNGSNGYTIQAKCSGLYLDIDSNGPNADANVRQYTKRGGKAQNWLFIPYTPSQPIPNGRYILQCASNPNYQIDIPGDTGDVSNGTNVQTHTSHTEKGYLAKHSKEFDFKNTYAAPWRARSLAADNALFR